MSSPKSEQSHLTASRQQAFFFGEPRILGGVENNCPPCQAVSLSQRKSETCHPVKMKGHTERKWQAVQLAKTCAECQTFHLFTKRRDGCESLYDWTRAVS